MTRSAQKPCCFLSCAPVFGVFYSDIVNKLCSSFRSLMFDFFAIIVQSDCFHTSPQFILFVAHFLPNGVIDFHFVFALFSPYFRLIFFLLLPWRMQGYLYFPSQSSTAGSTASTSATDSLSKVAATGIPAAAAAATVSYQRGGEEEATPLISKADRA